MKLLQGDCLEKLKELKDNSIDICIADPPYGRFKHLDWDVKIEFEKLWKELWRVCKPTCPIFLFGDFKFAMEIYNSQPKWFKYEIVWNKMRTTTPLLSKKRFGKATEYILVFYKKQPVYNYLKYHKYLKAPKLEIKSDKNYGGIYGKCSSKPSPGYDPKLPINVLEGSANTNNKTIKKITEKPQFLLEHLLKYFSNEGDTCLDFCMGSGSCGVACKTLNRNFVGIELNKEHFKLAKERLDKII